MENKPFTIQSPEKLAMEYGGNKQKLAEAMQMGIVDPTAGTLAGMFIDRMRAAQMQEQAPQQTVAQQVFAPPQPQMPPQGMPQGGPPPAPAGLGATPQAGAMPQMGGAPQPPMPEAPTDVAEELPVEFAAGGLTTLPVPDTMFDEPDDGGYANGGLVAFAGGGWTGAKVTSPYGAKRSYEVHPGIDFGVGRGTPITPIADGVVEVASTDKVNGNYVVVRHPDGKTTSYSHLDKLGVEKGQPVSASDALGLSGSTGRSTGPHLHLGARDEKGNRIDPNKLLKDPSALMRSGERDIYSGLGRMMSAEDAMAFGRKATEATPEETDVENQLRARYQEMRSPEYSKQEHKENLGNFFYKAAAGVLGSKAANVWEAIGESAAANMPDYFASEKERKALKDRALEGLADLGIKSRKRRQEALEIGMDLYKSGLTAEQAQKELAFRQEELATRVSEGALDRNASLAAASMRTSNPSDLDTMMAIMTRGTPQQKAALREVMKLKAPGQNMAIPGMDGTPASGPWTQFQT